MKALFKILTAFFYLNSVSPAFTFYMQDENPNAGYVAEVSTMEQSKNKLNGYKKYLVGNNNQKYIKLMNEHAVDSHFTVMKSPSKAIVTAAKQVYSENMKVHRNTGNPKRTINANDGSNLKHDGREVNANENLHVLHKEKQKTTSSEHRGHNSNNVQTHNNYQRDHLRNSDNNNEKKSKYVAINERRSSVSMEQMPINVKSVKQQPIHQSQRYHQKVPGLGVKDKILHKASTTNERNTQALSRNINDNVHRLLNVHKVDNKKREILKPQPMTPENYVISNTISDNIRKYINKEINNYEMRKKNVPPPRIGYLEETVDVSNKPYALFYRMNPQHIDEQEVLTDNTLAGPSNGAYSDNITWKYENHAENPKTKSKRTPNVKLHKKVHTHYLSEPFIK